MRSISTRDEIKINKKTKKEILKNILTTIKFNDERKDNIGSLLRLFVSDFFDINLLINYLDRKEDQGSIDYLVNNLHEKFINESYFYIPQLCTMITYKNYYESIENYLLERCVDHLKFTLKIHWLISSYIENADMKYRKKYDRLIQRIEMTLVNGRRATMSTYRMYNNMIVKSDEEVYKHSLDKEYRLNYFDKVMRFYHDLRIMCEKLKDIPKENIVNPTQSRNPVMRGYLRSFNNVIRNLVSKVIDPNVNAVIKGLFKGFILPFDDSNSTLDENNTLIVNFLPEYSFCFSTKARVPVKITAETIKVKECVDWDELYIPDVKKNDLNIKEYASIADFFTKLESKDESPVSIIL
jgi:hypothetical protein